jgi:glycosyltransferase involved in cell wall biosynthesis
MVNVLPDKNATEEAPCVAIISNAHTPYRLHLHKRIASELPDIRLWSIYTHETSNANWPFEMAAETRPVLFGRGESAHNQSRLLRQPYEWLKAGRIIEWIRSRKIRAVVVFGYNDLGRFRLIRWCHDHQVPCFLFGDSNILAPHPPGLLGTLKSRYLHSIVRECTGVMPCGSLGARYFAQFGAKPERTYFFPYEPDYNLIQLVDPTDISTARARIGLSPSSRVILFSGRLIGIKRPDLLLKAFISIAAGKPEWHLVFAGGGPLERDLLEQVIPALRERVHFTGFIEESKTLAALYRASDVLVLPSNCEPWGVVITEAAAAGLAIVCTSVVGAAAEVVRDRVNGRLIPPADLSALVNALREVTKPEYLKSMKRMSSEMFRQWHSRVDPVKELRRALQDAGVLDVRGRPRSASRSLLKLPLQDG